MTFGNLREMLPVYIVENLQKIWEKMYCSAQKFWGGTTMRLNIYNLFPGEAPPLEVYPTIAHNYFFNLNVPLAIFLNGDVATRDVRSDWR